MALLEKLKLMSKEKILKKDETEKILGSRHYFKIWGFIWFQNNYKKRFAIFSYTE